MTCNSCGAEMPAESRFCPECGAPNFAPPVAGTPPTAPPPGAVPAGVTPPPAAVPGAPVAPGAGASVPAPPESPPKKGVPLAVKIGVPAVLLIGGGALAYTFLSGSSDGGTGAETPEAAVEAMATSLDDDDLLGMLTVMAPEEIGPLSDVFDAALAKAGELELLAVTDTGLAELDVSVEGMTLETEELHPEVVKVTITGGSIGADFTSPDLGLALVTPYEVQLPTSEQMEGEQDLAGLTDDTDLDETFVVTVQHDGEWYVSPLYTLAEYLREAEDLGDPDFDASRGDVVGAESPVAAVEATVAAIEGLDLEAGAAVLPPGELGIARDYLELMLGEIDEEELEADRDDSDLTVDELQLREGEDLGDGRRQVIIESFAYSFEDDYDDETVEGTFEGLCVEVDEEVCLPQLLAESERDPILAELAPEAVYVVAVERDGGWYVSPMETLAAYLTDAIERLDDRHLRAMGMVEPQALAVGEPFEGELMSPFTVDALTFEAEEETLYMATVTTDADVPMGASIHAIGGPTYGEGSAFATSSEATFGGPGVFVATDTAYAIAVSVDVYLMELEDAMDAGPVAYTMVVEPLEIEDELEVDEPTEIDLDAGETATFSFEATEDDQFAAVFDGDGTAQLVEPEGYATSFEDGDFLSIYDDGEHLVVVTADEDDTFTVGIEDASQPEPEPEPEPDGGASLIPAPDSLDGIDEITFGEIQLVSVEDDGIVDFVFEGTGGEVSVVAAGGDGSAFDPVLVVFDEDFEVVFESEGDAAERRAEGTVDTEEGAIYVVSVTGFAGAGGDVRILVDDA